MKGGYKIIDFKNVSLSGTPVTMADVLVDLLNNYEKVVLLSNVVLSGSAKDDCFSAVLSDGNGGVKLNCYDGYISINSSGAVTYTVASASGMAGDIANLQNVTKDLHIIAFPQYSSDVTYRIKVAQNFMGILAFTAAELVLINVRFDSTPLETKITENSPFSALTNTESKARQFEITVLANKRVTLIGWAEMTFKKL